MKDDKKKGDIFDSIFDAIGDLIEKLVWIIWLALEFTAIRLIKMIKKKYGKTTDFEIPLTPRCREIAKEHEKFRKSVRRGDA